MINLEPKTGRCLAGRVTNGGYPLVIKNGSGTNQELAIIGQPGSECSIVPAGTVNSITPISGWADTQYKDGSQ